MGVDTEQERSPPPSPTRLEFPEYHALQSDELQGITDFKVIYEMLMAIRKPQDITIDHVKALNLKIELDIEATQMIPDECFQGLPPLVWEKEKEAEDSDGDAKSHTMGNGNPYPSSEKYDILVKELSFDNDDAFREVARMTPRPGRDRVRVAQTRKFWLGLERMAQFWDTSLDQYYEKLVPAKSEQPEADKDIQQQPDTEAGNNSPMDTTSDAPNDETVIYKRVYRGRRLGTGREMGADIREDTMRGLLEMVAWPFQCQAVVPSQLPRLNVQGLLFPVRHTLVAGRVPQDRQAARGGVLEGPILGVQCRDETTFRKPGEEPGHDKKEFCDVFREVGAMLLLAQERSREGTVEVKPGDGKWWTTVPRFGGAEHEGVTGEAANAEKDKENENENEGDKERGKGEASKSGNDDSNRHKRSRYANTLISSRRSARPRKLTVSEKWKIIEPGPSLWDRKMKYMHIGKPKNSPYDDIYMLSQINHHVSILHLRVHRRYIDFLTKGSSDFSEESSDDQPWSVLKLRRSKWYDLMDVEQRLQVFHGLWKLFHYSLGSVD